MRFLGLLALLLSAHIACATCIAQLCSTSAGYVVAPSLPLNHMPIRQHDSGWFMLVV